MFLKKIFEKKDPHYPFRKGEPWIYDTLHIIVLILSIFLLVSISIDTFKDINFSIQPRFLKFQFWICIVFLADFFIEWFMAEKKWSYLLSHFLFFLVSIPYLNIFHYFNIQFSAQTEYWIRFIPLVRGGYALAIVMGWFTYNRATSLFLSYLVTLVATIYFGSLVFYVCEQNVNPLVVTYSDALWWAFMDATTVGSNIIAVTLVGRVLSVLLAALGMMMFPIFTVYVTNLIQKHNEEGMSAILKPVDTPDVKKDHGSETKADKTPDNNTDNNPGNNTESNPDNKAQTDSSSNAASNQN